MTADVDDDSDPIRVVAICGSLREHSYTRLGLERALEEAARGSVETELLDLREWELPAFDADVDREEAGDAAELAARVRGADSILLGSPMYHGSYSSPLKTALDYCGFDEFEDTTVGLLAVAGGAFPVTALEHLRSVCRALNAWVLPWEVAIPRARTIIEGDTFTDEAIEQRVDELGERAVEYARISPHQHAFESEENVGAAHR